MVGLIGVDVAKEEKMPEPVLSGEEDPGEDPNDNRSLLN